MRRSISSRLLPVVVVLTLAMAPAFAQSLNWYGQTGALSTPLAYVTSSPANSIGAPTVAFHMSNAGDVLGFQSQFSITAGAFQRMEFGFSHTLSSENTLGGGLFQNDFFSFHVKVNLLRENFHKKLLPAISVGFIEQPDIRRECIQGGKDDNESSGHLIELLHFYSPKQQKQRMPKKAQTGTKHRLG